MKNKDTYYFSVAAVLAAAIAHPAVAKAVCGCVWSDVRPSSVNKTYSKEIFRPLGTTVYQAELAFDGLYTFKTPTTPQVWVDFKATTAAATQINNQLCRMDYLGVLLACGSATGFPTADLAQHEAPVVVGAGVYGVATSDWDRIFVNVWPSTVVDPVSVPIHVSCW